jgi:predicted RNase H-like HicB family nuclease
MYPILIEDGTADGAFGIIVPDLPGCFSAGDTLDEALDAVKVAVAAWIETAVSAGQTVPQPSSLKTARRFAGYECRGSAFALSHGEPLWMVSPSAS